MKYISAITTLVLICSVADGQEIPLKSIWAWNMPGTTNLRSLAPEGKENPLLEDIGKVLQNVPPLGKSAKPAFAVLGTGGDALKAAHEVLVERKAGPNSFPIDSDISIVFFSHLFNYYVHIEKVERKKDTLEICYRFVPHRTKEMTKQFALIPIKLDGPGNVDVKIVQLTQNPIGFRSVDPKWVERVIARSFSFSVIGER